MGREARERRVVELTDAAPLSPRVRWLRFARRDGPPIRWTSGQWCNFYVPTAEGPVKRSYSLCSALAHEGPDALDIAVTHVGEGRVSDALHGMPLGTRLEADGPWGVFTRDRAPFDAPKLYVATGTGLTPIRPMLQEEVERSDGPPLVLLFGCRAEQDLLWRDEIARWTERCPRLRYEITLSRPGAPWRGRTGYVQEHVPQLWSELATDPEHPPHAFVCGLERMVGVVRSALREELGARRRQVHTERYD